MGNVYMVKVDVTGTYAALSALSVHGAFQVSCPCTNSDNVTFKDKQGHEVEWEPGEWHDFRDCDLSEISVKGTVGDDVVIHGNIW